MPKTKKKGGIAKNEQGFTARQQKLIDVYDGNANAAAVKAGLNKSYARRLVTQSNIKNAIALREKVETRPKRIKTRQERQKFWSDMMDDEKETSRNKLRASELLAKSEMDFGTTDVNVNVVTVADIFARTGAKAFTEPIIDAPALPSGDDTGDVGDNTQEGE